MMDYPRIFALLNLVRILVMFKSYVFDNYFGNAMGTVTVKVDEELKRMMSKVKINWSEYIREAIRRRIELEERREAARRLLEELRSGRHAVPKGFINRVLREGRGKR